MAADGHFPMENALPTTPDGATPGRSAPLAGFSFAFVRIKFKVFNKLENLDLFMF